MTGIDNELESLKQKITQEIQRLTRIKLALDGYDPKEAHTFKVWDKDPKDAPAIEKPVNLTKLREVAYNLGISPGTIVSWGKRGKIKKMETQRIVAKDGRVRDHFMVDADEVQNYAASIEGNGRLHNHPQKREAPMKMERMVEEVMKNAPPNVAYTGSEVRRGIHRTFNVTVLQQSVLATLSAGFRKGIYYRPDKGKYMIKDRSKPADEHTTSPTQ